MSTRRQFCRGMAVGLAAPLAAGEGRAGGEAPPRAAGAGEELPLSFLREEFRDLEEWKRAGRAKLRELLHHAPAPCDPRPEVLERVDCGAYVRERLRFNTAPEVR